MNSQRWARLRQLFDEAAGLAPDERIHFLDRACSDDHDLKDEVLTLLQNQQASRDLIDEAVVRAVPDSKRPAAPSLARGTILGPYEIEELLGAGGMGEVFKARDQRLGRRIALKVLEKTTCGADRLARFEREARTASVLNHPNIVTIYDVGHDGDHSYIAMELVDGDSLQARSGSTALPLEEVLAIGCQVAAGLAAAHSKGIVHRDLKPGNVMLDPDGTAKIVDFGLAKQQLLAGGATLEENPTLTEEGVILGTVNYMSPEQAGGRPLDHRSDQFSLGVILYELATGRHPFPAAGPMETLAVIMRETPVPLGEVNPSLPLSFAGAVERCLAKQPQQRYDSTGDLVRLLDGVRDDPIPRSFAPTETAIRQAPVSAANAEAAREPEPSRDTGPARIVTSERRQVAVLVAKLIGYDRLAEQRSPEEVERALSGFHLAARQTVERHRGVLNRSSYEGLVAFFGLPTANEDDALRAVRAARELLATLSRLDPDGNGALPLSLGSAVSLGRVVAQRLAGAAEPYRVTGEPVSLAESAAREAQAAQILVTPEVERQVSNLVHTEESSSVQLRGQPGRVRLHSVVGIDEESREVSFDSPGSSSTPFTGRDLELGALLGAFDRARRGEGQTVTVVGEAGAGKSRLLHELRERLSSEAVQIFEGRCQSYGGNTPYLPLVQITREILGTVDAEGTGDQVSSALERLTAIDPDLVQFFPFYLHLLAIPSAEHPLPESLGEDELAHLLRQSLVALITVAASLAPMLLLLEDWHWSDEGSRAVVRELTQMAASFPLLVTIASRPEGATELEGCASQRVRLEPLGLDIARSFLSSALGAEEAPEDLARLLHERTGGNPFFLEEIGRALMESGRIRIERGRVHLIGEVADLELPSAIQAVISTRIDRIDPEARGVLRRAAAIGHEFDLETLRRTVDDDTNLLPCLEALKERGLIRQTRVLPDPAFRFRHVLIQEVAYDSLLGHQRMALHGLIGKAIEEIHAGHLGQHYDRLAHHFAAAREWEQVVRYGGLASERALRLYQWREALALLERALDGLENLPGGEEREKSFVRLLTLQERICGQLGMSERQQEAIDGQLAVLEPAGRSGPLIDAYLQQGELLAAQQRFREAEEVLRKASTMSRELGDPLQDRNALQSLSFLYWAQDRDQEALEQQEKVVEIDRGGLGPQLLEQSLNNLAAILHRLGRYEEGIERVNEGIELGGADPAWLATSHFTAGALYRSLGDNEKAEAAMRASLEADNTVRMWTASGFSATTLANLLLERGKTEEALELVQQQVDMTRQKMHARALANSLLFLGETKLKHLEDPDGFSHLREAAQLYRKLQDTASEVQVLTQIATVHEERSELTKAIATWQQVRELERARGETVGEIRALEAMARAAEAAGDIAVACQHLADAAELTASAGDRSRQAGLLNRLGILAWRSGNFLEALTRYETALGLFEELSELANAGLALNSIGLTLKGLGRYGDAEEKLAEAVELHRSRGLGVLEGHALAALGDLHLELGKPEAARQEYESSLELRRARGDRLGEGWMSERLARAWEALGDPSQATRHARRAIEIAGESGDARLAEACAGLLDEMPN